MRYLTLAEPFAYQADPIKGSRFLALLTPAADEEAALAWVRATEARHPDASHTCWAWRLRGGKTRIWDAGEPRGSAGRPILAQLEGHEVLDVAAAVVRWFGGTELGVGGLMRAYGGAVGMALDRAPLVEVAATVDVVLVHGYPDTNAVRAAIAAAGAQIVDTAFDESVRIVVRVDESRLAALVVDLRDRTGGRVGIEDGCDVRPAPRTP